MHPYHDSTLIKVMMANGQQLQPMHALFSSIPLGELEVSHSLFSWEEAVSYTHLTLPTKLEV